MKPLPGQKELPLVIDHRKTFYDFIKDPNSGKVTTSHQLTSDEMGVSPDEFIAIKGKRLAKLFIKYDDKPTSEMWIEILRLSRELVK